MGEVIAFIFGGLVLIWAFRSAAFAFSGGERSGRHELAPAPAAERPTPPEEVRRRAATREAARHRIYRLMNFGLSLAALAALVAMLVGVLLT